MCPGSPTTSLKSFKLVPDRPVLVDFAIGLVIFALILPERQVLFFGKIQIAEGL